MFGKKVIHSKHLSAQKKRKRVFVSIFSILLVGIILGGVIYFARASFLQIKSIIITGNTTISAEDLEKIVLEKTSGFYFFGLIPKKSILFYSKKDIEETLKKDFQHIKNIKVGSIGFSKLEISVSEYKPSALWCGDFSNTYLNVSVASTTKSIEPSANCYFLDNTGFIFSEAPVFSDGVYFKYYGVINSPNPIKKQYLPSDAFREISTFLSNINKLGLDISGLEKQEDGDFKVSLSGGGYIIFNRQYLLSQTFENLQSFLNNREIFPKGFNSSTTIDHIDLRAGNKILYKIDN